MRSRTPGVMLRHCVRISSLPPLAAALLVCLFARPASAQYTGIDLNGTAGQSAAYAIAGGKQVGWGSVGSSHARLWSGSASSGVDVNPAGAAQSFLTGTTGTVHVGAATLPGLFSQFYPYVPIFHATLWAGGKATDIHPPQFSWSSANSTDGFQHGGYGTFQVPNTYHYYEKVTHAVLWTDVGGVAVPTDIHPPNYIESAVKAVSGGRQVGAGTTVLPYTYPPRIPPPPYVGLNPLAWPWEILDFAGYVDPGIQAPIGTHALLWLGAPDTVIDLHPAAYFYSYASGISGDQIVGTGHAFDSTNHALLWEGMPLLAPVSLHPAGYTQSFGAATNGSKQVGFGMRSGTSQYHALVWSGTAASAVDLHPFVGSRWVNSYAVAIDDGGNVAGFVEDANDVTHAFTWKVK
jgi:hypothetical protein